MTYVYDANGNIVSKTPYTNVTSSDLSTATQGTAIIYGYGDSNWSDKLTSYNGQTISYDASGNPTSYRGETVTWNGRLMTSFTKDDRRYEYSYNSDGMRTVKKVYENNELVYTYTYIWDGDVLLGGRMEVTDADEPITIRYLYDDSGELYGMDYNGNGYFGFIKNLQGDIVSIVPLDSESNVEVNMEYDAWGKPIIKQASSAAEGLLMAMLMAVTNVGYRGYFYDFETGLYYLRSRYYDPEIGRFINADDTDQLKVPSTLVYGLSNEVLSMNVFAYCGNNPINREDYNGEQTIIPEFVNLIYTVNNIVNSFCDEGALIVEANASTYYLGHIGIDFMVKINGNSLYSFLDILSTYKVLYFYALSLFTENLFKKFEETFNREFLLNEECVAFEIQEHFMGLMWSLRKKGYNLPYYMLLYCWFHKIFKISDIRNHIYYACKDADIYEKDVYDNSDEAKVYDYYNGINDVYKNTNKDPYYYPADNKRKNKFNPKWNKNYFLLK